jgi:hypothetical protein
VFCPFETQSETEQRARAELFAQRGLATCLPEADLTPSSLARAVERALANSAPRPDAVDMRGAARSVAALEHLASRALPRIEPLPAPAILPAASALDATREWQPLRDGLARRHADGAPLRVWWRDDDARHDTPALRRLLGVAAELAAPLTLAVIPFGAGCDLADRLDAADPAGNALTVALHGWRHENHAPAGEKSAEWGAHRPLDERLAEIERGHQMLRDLFGSRLLPMVVPPWNRIAPDLAAALPDLGLPLLSAFGRAAPSPGGPLLVNTHADPVNWRATRSAVEVNTLVAMTLRAGTKESIGLLTHHLVHDEAIWRLTARWIDEMRAFPGFEWDSARSFTVINR